MDWEYIEAEIIETLIYRIENGKNRDVAVDEIFREYRREFPRYHNHLASLKKSIELINSGMNMEIK